MCVDEETAYAWPVCEKCDNELLVEICSEQYLCDTCGSTRTATRMSLEVYIHCEHIPDSYRIKVKVSESTLQIRREYGTYLATARRHRRRLKMQKRDE